MSDKYISHLVKRAVTTAFVYVKNGNQIKIFPLVFLSPLVAYLLLNQVCPLVDVECLWKKVCCLSISVCESGAERATVIKCQHCYHEIGHCIRLKHGQQDWLTRLNPPNFVILISSTVLQYCSTLLVLLVVVVIYYSTSYY